jgi:hypothetical protein
VVRPFGADEGPRESRLLRISGYAGLVALERKSIYLRPLEKEIARPDGDRIRAVGRLKIPLTRDRRFKSGSGHHMGEISQ